MALHNQAPKFSLSHNKSPVADFLARGVPIFEFAVGWHCCGKCSRKKRLKNRKRKKEAITPKEHEEEKNAMGSVVFVTESQLLKSGNTVVMA